MITRRSLITGIATFLAAPAIVRASRLMPVKAWAAEAPPTTAFGWVDAESVSRYLGLAITKIEGETWHIDPPRKTTRYAAGERIHRGDVIVVRNGIAYRAHYLKGDDWHAVAASNSYPHYCNMASDPTI